MLALCMSTFPDALHHLKELLNRVWEKMLPSSYGSKTVSHTHLARLRALCQLRTATPAAVALHCNINPAERCEWSEIGGQP